MSTEQQNITSYEIGLKPFKHDATRGKWLTILDFYSASLSHAFSFRYFSFWPLLLIHNGGIFFLIPYILNLCVFTIPIFFIQSFLGQFSSSGFISAYRIAPMFKGIGYVILLLNLASVSYFVVIAAVPLIYLYNSLNPILPWMTCDNSWNTANCTTKNNYSTYDRGLNMSSTQYFYYAVSLEGYLDLETSWRVLMCTLVVWSLIGFILTTGVEIMGTIIRYFTMIIGSCLFILLIRFLCLEGSWTAITHFLTPQINKLLSIGPWVGSPIASLLAFGAGWGTMLTMSSYNNFNENIGKYALNINLINLVILSVTGLISNIAFEYLNLPYYGSLDEEDLSYVYIFFSYLFGTMAGSNFWCLLFFMMLFLGELTACTIQMFTVTTAIFDEFESIRIYKKEFIIVSIFCLSLISIAFSLNVSFPFIGYMFSASAVTQMLICFIELMIVLWIYGRLRFQRDIEFMLNLKYPTWKFNSLRIVTPLMTLFSLLLFLFLSLSRIESWLSFFLVFCFKFLPIIVIPIIIIWQLYQSTGNFCERFKKLCRPMDWYPADPDEQVRYGTLANTNETGFEDLFDENQHNIN